MTADGPLLVVDDVTVRFGGLVANDAVQLQIERGRVTGLIGPNGAGKTTLFNVITGAQAPTSGRVRLSGEDITDWDREHRANAGIARTFQNLSLVDSLSALDNVTIGLGRFRGVGMLGSMTMSGRVRRHDRELRAVAREALAFVELVDVADVTTGDLSYGHRRRLELARALAMAPTLLLLDEPSAGMGPRETDELIDIVARARDELGVSVLLVEHDMAVVRALASDTTVLEFGSVIARGDTASVLRDPRVAEAYLGKRETSHAA